MDRRIVVTGMGCVSPLGLSVAETWEGFLQGRLGAGPVDAFPTDGFPSRIAAAVKGFDAQSYLGPREVRRTARFTQFAIVAMREALAEAALDLAQEDPTRVGLQIGSAIGSIPGIEEQALILDGKGPRRINPTFVPTVIASAAACYLAVEHGIKGPTNAPCAACATGIVALGDGMRLLERDDVDVVLAGGTESSVSPLALASFGRLGALSMRNDDPAHACRPFDASRDGTVLGEGAAVLVLETAEHALRRGAPILAELAGYGLAEDAFHITAPEPNGDGAARAMKLALKDGATAADAVDCIVAHGTGTPLNDVSETRAIHTALGPRARDVLVTSNKGATGHTLGAAGAIATMTAVKILCEGVVPPTANLETPDPECDLDYVPHQPRRVDAGVVLANAIGFGGQNASLLIHRWEG